MRSPTRSTCSLGGRGSAPVRSTGRRGGGTRRRPRERPEWGGAASTSAGRKERPVLTREPTRARKEPGSSSASKCSPTCSADPASRSSGLVPLPAKAKKPDLAPYVQSLTAAYQLPDTEVSSHDDLQAVVAALIAAAAVGGPAIALAKGAPASVVVHADGSRLRIEGYIWDVKPSR